MLGCARAREAGRGTKFIHSFNLMSYACCRSVAMNDIREASNLEKIHTSQSIDGAKEESGVEQPRAGFWRRYRRRFGSFLFVIILALAALTLLDLLNG